jgi:hypothetical protein
LAKYFRTRTLGESRRARVRVGASINRIEQGRTRQPSLPVFRRDQDDPGQCDPIADGANCFQVNRGAPAMLLILLMLGVLVGSFAVLAALVYFGEDILRPR